MYGGVLGGGRTERVVGERGEGVKGGERQTLPQRLFLEAFMTPRSRALRPQGLPRPVLLDGTFPRPPPPAGAVRGPGNKKRARPRGPENGGFWDSLCPLGRVRGAGTTPRPKCAAPRAQWAPMNPGEQPERAATGEIASHVAPLLDPLPAPTKETANVPPHGPQPPSEEFFFHRLPFVQGLVTPACNRRGGDPLRHPPWAARDPQNPRMRLQTSFRARPTPYAPSPRPSRPLPTG